MTKTGPFGARGARGRGGNLTRLGCVVLVGWIAACSRPASPAEVPSPALKQSVAGQEAARVPLTEPERAVEARLRAHVLELADKIGERNPEQPWELAAAADYVAAQFEGFGYVVERQGYEVAGVAAQNLAVTVRGVDRAEDVIVVGAHYDSPVGGPGRNGNASGVAGLLELARMFRSEEGSRTVRFVAFAVSEPPYAGSDDMGSLRYVRHLAAAGEQVVAMVNLDRIGSFRSDGPSEPVPPGSAHVRMGVTPGADDVERVLADAVRKPPLAVESFRVRAEAESDHWSFARGGVPAVWITGES